MSETGDNDDDEDSDDGEAGEAREALVRSDVPLSGEGESIPEPTTAAQLPPGAPEQSAAAIAATAAMDKIDADESSGDDETSGDESSGDESSSDEEGRDDQAEEAAEGVGIPCALAKECAQPLECGEACDLRSAELVMRSGRRCRCLRRLPR